MNLKVEKKLGEVHVTVEYPLYGEGTKTIVKIAAPKVLQALEQDGVKVGRLLKNATLDNRNEETRRQTWVFEAVKPVSVPKQATPAPKATSAPTAAPKKPRRRRKTAKTTTEEG